MNQDLQDQQIFHFLRVQQTAEQKPIEIKYEFRQDEPIVEFMQKLKQSYNLHYTNYLQIQDTQISLNDMNKTFQQLQLEFKPNQVIEIHTVEQNMNKQQDTNFTSQNFQPPKLPDESNQKSNIQSSGYDVSFIQTGILTSSQIQPALGQFQQNAPERKMTRDGLNVMGPCKNSNCNYNKKDVVLQIGFNQFKMEEVISNARCTGCNQNLDTIQSLIFVNCNWEIYRMEKQIVKDEQQQFQQEQNVKYKEELVKKKSGSVQKSNGFLQITRDQLRGFKNIIVKVQPL